MLSLVKKVAKTLAPNLVAYWGVRRRNHRIASAGRVLRSVAPTDYRLGFAELKIMNIEYPALPEYGYDSETLEIRGAQRAENIIRRLPLKGGEVLEVGCWDGMIGAALQSKRVKYTGVDLRDEGFDARATQAGARLIKMDAGELHFKSETFDLVFSENAFEHFENPKKVLEEIIRVTKPGGHILIDFGPLFMSPWGLHAYRSIRVPYCQFLFKQETLAAFVKNENLTPIDEYCNGWQLSQWRSLFADQRLDCVSFCEHQDLSHIELINKYAAIFRSYTDCIQELTTTQITGAFMRRKE